MSQWWQRGGSLGDAKDKSITEGQEDSPKGKQVKGQGKFHNLKPGSEALEK